MTIPDFDALQVQSRVLSMFLYVATTEKNKVNFGLFAWSGINNRGERKDSPGKYQYRLLCPSYFLPSREFSFRQIFYKMVKLTEVFPW